MECWVGMEFIEKLQLGGLFQFDFKYKYRGDKIQGKVSQ